MTLRHEKEILTVRPNSLAPIVLVGASTTATSRNHRMFRRATTDGRALGRTHRRRDPPRAQCLQVEREVQSQRMQPTYGFGRSELLARFGVANPQAKNDYAIIVAERG